MRSGGATFTNLISNNCEEQPQIVEVIRHFVASKITSTRCLFCIMKKIHLKFQNFESLDIRRTEESRYE